MYLFFQFLFLSAFILLHIQCTNPEPRPCLKEKPKLGKDDPLTVEFFYVTRFGGNIPADVCQVVNEFKGQINIKYKFGALAKLDESGKLNCGPNSCTPDRRQACRYKSYDKFDTCGELPFFDLVQIADCICQKQGDDILIQNGKEREGYAIDPAHLPTLVFAQKYDPCLDTSSAATIKAYVCELYQGKAAPCTGS